MLTSKLPINFTEKAIQEKKIPLRVKLHAYAKTCLNINLSQKLRRRATLPFWIIYKSLAYATTNSHFLYNISRKCFTISLFKTKF